ncbi:hypothetical protein LOC67_17000 [Stieleria sp. JC731]|uniref:hypothetical protein n=1 Tax=Pirellulaceae TaxID=2691357 RepID=UPI001E44C62C|nr:hypothetical protein [Stieleria sp. JC731]MCC9602256.1 hypothetical protein [Stieleria sp. JC731]
MKNTVQTFARIGFTAGFALNIILKLTFAAWREAEGVEHFVAMLIVPGVIYGIIFALLLVPIGFLYAYFSKPAEERAGILSTRQQQASPVPIAVAGTLMTGYQGFLLTTSSSRSDAHPGWLAVALIGTVLGTIVGCLVASRRRDEVVDTAGGGDAGDAYELDEPSDEPKTR